MSDLKLFVWRQFAPDYYDGLAFAIAHDEPEARRIIVDKLPYDPSDWGPCDVHEITIPIGAACVGRA